MKIQKSDYDLITGIDDATKELIKAEKHEYKSVKIAGKTILIPKKYDGLIIDFLKIIRNEVVSNIIADLTKDTVTQLSPEMVHRSMEK